MPARAALRLFREQAWAVARMLHAGYGGLDPEVFARILGLRSDEDWAALEVTWRRYLEEEIGLDVDGNTLRPDRWVLNVGGYRGNGSHQTAVTLRDDGEKRGRKLASVVLDPIPEDAPEALLTTLRRGDGKAER